LLGNNVHCNTHIGILDDFDKHFRNAGLFRFNGSFREHVLQINRIEHSKDFAHQYLADLTNFLSEAGSYRKSEATIESNNPLENTNLLNN